RGYRSNPASSLLTSTRPPGLVPAPQHPRFATDRQACRSLLSTERRGALGKPLGLPARRTSRQPPGRVAALVRLALAFVDLFEVAAPPLAAAAGALSAAGLPAARLAAARLATVRGTAAFAAARLLRLVELLADLHGDLGQRLGLRLDLRGILAVHHPTEI